MHAELERMQELALKLCVVATTIDGVKKAIEHGELHIPKRNTRMATQCKLGKLDLLYHREAHQTYNFARHRSADSSKCRGKANKYHTINC